MGACSLGERPLLGKKRKKGDDGGGVRPEAAVGLHIEEMGNGVLVHSVLGVAREHGIPGDDVPRKHFREDVGGGDVEINEGGGDEEVGVEPRSSGVAVDGTARPQRRSASAEQALRTKGKVYLLGATRRQSMEQ